MSCKMTNEGPLLQTLQPSTMHWLWEAVIFVAAVQLLRWAAAEPPMSWSGAGFAIGGMIILAWLNTRSRVLAFRLPDTTRVMVVQLEHYAEPQFVGQGMPVFEVTLKGYDYQNPATENLVKWVKAKDRETLKRGLEYFRLMPLVDAIREMTDLVKYGFDDGVNLVFHESLEQSKELLATRPMGSELESWAKQVADVRGDP